MDVDGLVALAETLGPTAVMATAAGASLAGIGAALFELAEKAAGVGGKLNDMSDKTGIAVPGRQKQRMK